MRSEWRAGWRSLVGAAGANSCGAAFYTYAAGLLVKPLVQAEGWTRTQIGFGQTLVLVTIALAMPFVGAATDRFGPRTVGIVGLLFYGLMCLGLSVLPVTLALYYGALLAIAVSGSLTSGVVFAPVAVARFRKWRGVALALVLGAPALLLIPLSPLLQLAIDEGGWRAGYRFLGLVPIVIGIPCALFFLGGKVPASASVAVSGTPQVGLSFRAALATGDYWKILIGTHVAALALGGFLNQLPALMSDAGASATTVASMLSLFVGMVVVGRTSIGYLLDRFRPPLVAGLVMLSAALGVWALMLDGASLILSALAVATLGMAMGAESDIPAFFCARQFGLKAYAAIYGTYGMSAVSGLGLGALLFGAIYDAFHSYAAAIALSSALFLSAALLFVSIRKEFHG